MTVLPGGWRLPVPVGQTLLQALVHQGLDLQFLGVRQLVAVRSEQLDAIVLIAIVRGGNHHAKVSAQAARQHGDARRRQRPEQAHIHTHGGETGGQRWLQHVAGKARILADHHQMAARVGPAKKSRRGHAKAHRHFG
jgi:hypothetical protein